MITSILGYNARVCNKTCKVSFEADRACGLNYGLHKFNNVVCLHREEWSLVSCQCAYCGEKIEGEIPENLKEKYAL